MEEARQSPGGIGGVAQIVVAPIGRPRVADAPSSPSRSLDESMARNLLAMCSGVAPALPRSYFGEYSSEPLPARIVARLGDALTGESCADPTLTTRVQDARRAAGLPMDAGESRVAMVGAMTAAVGAQSGGARPSSSPDREAAAVEGAAAALRARVHTAARPALLLGEGLLCEEEKCALRALVYCTCCRPTGALRCATHDRARHMLVRGRGRAVLASCEGGPVVRDLRVDEFVMGAVSGPVAESDIETHPIAMPEVSKCTSCGSCLVEPFTLRSCGAVTRYDVDAAYLVAQVDTWRCVARRAGGVHCGATWRAATSTRREYIALPRVSATLSAFSDVGNSSECNTLLKYW